MAGKVIPLDPARRRRPTRQPLRADGSLPSAAKKGTSPLDKALAAVATSGHTRFEDQVAVFKRVFRAEADKRDHT